MCTIVPVHSVTPILLTLARFTQRFQFSKYRRCPTRLSFGFRSQANSMLCNAMKKYNSDALTDKFTNTHTNLKQC